MCLLRTKKPQKRQRRIKDPTKHLTWSFFANIVSGFFFFFFLTPLKEVRTTYKTLLFKLSSPISTAYGNVHVESFKLTYQGYWDKTNVSWMFLETSDITLVFLVSLEWKRIANKTGIRCWRMDQVQFVKDSL